MAEVTRDRVVAASIFHVIRSYLYVYKGEESFRGIKFAIDPNWEGWNRLHFYITKYIGEAGGTIIHNGSANADVAIPFTPSTMSAKYGIVIPAISGAAALNSNKEAVEIPSTFGSLFDFMFDIIDHGGVGPYESLKAVANSVYESAFNYFYELYEANRILKGELRG